MEQLQILWVSRSYSLPGNGIKEHTHPYYHMFCISSGTCQFTLKDEKHTLKTGDCVLVPKDTRHSFYTDEDGQTEYLEIKFTARDVSEHFLEKPMFSTGNPLMGLLIAQIIREYEEVGRGNDDAAAAFLSSVLYLIQEENEPEAELSSRYIDVHGFTALSQETVRYLDEHFSEDISLDSLADFLGYNKSYLCAAFKKDTDITILDCLNTIRIRRAAELIAYSDHSLPEVAVLCGFKTVTHFNCVFKKYVGITPGQVRTAYPVSVLDGSQQYRETMSNHPNRFMYSVLARKSFSFRDILEFGKNKL